ncbi:hypothetical protein G9P44_004047 [Scheffersomyces stipitis]|nr:hypothetical protein G9P44_004047 [Scheffersomyces stipitis]
MSTTVMDSSLSLSFNTLSVNKQIENDYTLAVKLFMNKNFDKSFKLIKELYEQSFSEYGKGLITERLFVKIVNLYLVEVGLALSATATLRLSQIESHQIVTSLLNNEITKRLSEIYGSELNFPLEIVYNYNLLLVTNRELLIVDDSVFLNKVRRMYSAIDYKADKDNKYLKKLVDLYTFEILPLFDEFDEARHVIESHPIFANDITASLKKVEDIQREKLNILETERQKKLETKRLENEQKLKEVQKKKELEASQNLTYKSIKEIQKQYSAGESSTSRQSSAAVEDSSPSQLQHIRDRLVYSLRMVSVYLKENSPIILIALLAIILSTKLINFRKLNLKDRLVETVRMAFKVSYL